MTAKEEKDSEWAGGRLKKKARAISRFISINRAVITTRTVGDLDHIRDGGGGNRNWTASFFGHALARSAGGLIGTDSGVAKAEDSLTSDSDA